MRNPLDDDFVLDETPQTEIASPCIRNCCLDQNDICMGCYRSLDEILAWSEVNRETKEQILLRAKGRKTQAA